jgi:hypothetical protein
MASKEGICRFCGTAQSLVKAHIIPAAFFRAIGIGRDAPLLVTDSRSSPFPKRAPIGVYDPAILCDECERRFDSVDAYGTKTLLHTLRGSRLTPMQAGHEVIGFQASGIDQELLNRFFIATLWRASVSTQPFFNRVHLGDRYEELAKAAVTEETLNSAFGVTMACWLSREGKDQNIGFMNPFAERYDGVKVYRFYFGRFIAYMKVDQRAFREPLSRSALGAQRDLVIIRRDHQSSKDFSAMRSTARAQYDNSIRVKDSRSHQVQH